MSIATVAQGSLFNDADQQGLGIDSRNLPGIVDPKTSKFDLLSTTTVTEGENVEAMRFSFDRPGWITGFDFDGVKDETFEYFPLPGGSRCQYLA